MRPVSVLLTNNTLGDRAGSELYVRDVALALLRRRHRPVAFSLVLGDVASELRRATVPVLDDLTRLAEPPDVIHGHHHIETLIASLTFPGTPVVNFCHGWAPWEEMPLHHPAVRRYVAVDEVCVDRLVREEGIARDRIDLLLNFVDLDRFRPRPPLPPRPQRGLVLSNYATAKGYAGVIIAACQAAGVAVDIIGAAASRPTDAPELIVREYDLVFAKGRAALEALAAGCSVVLADAAGAGPLVTPDNYTGLRARNFGIRELRHAHEPGWYEAQLANYTPAAAAEVSARVRAEAGMEPAIDRLLEIYEAAIAAPPGPGDASRAAALHCARIARPLKDAGHTRDRLAYLTMELEAARTGIDGHARTAADAQTQLASARASEQEVALARAEVQALQATAASLASAREEAVTARQSQLAELTSAREEIHTLRGQLAQLASTRAEVRALQSQIAAFQALPTLRLRDALLKAPMVGPVLQAGARRLARRLH